MTLRILLTASLLAALALAGCGGPGGVVPPQDDEGRYMVAMTSSLVFDPVEAKVPAGATVVWTNTASGVPHDVAGYRGDPIKDDRTAFSSTREPPEGLGRLMQPGESWAYTFNQTGTWTIWCHTHHEQGMKMVLHVT